MNGDIYFENGNETGRIEKWSTNVTSTTFVTKFNGSCYGLFVDINNTLYCSLRIQNQVVSVTLNNNTNFFAILAGTGSSGSTSAAFRGPWGIFVDINFDLYVAHAGNNRIQRFRRGELNGTTVAGKGVPYNLTLKYPTDVILDADGSLYIADNNNNRIIRAGSTTFYCVAGCSGSSGSAPDQLNKPYSLRFDSQGNIYVADEFNSRIQKFILTTNLFGKFSQIL
jgi:sugar lactone lactonase YvrE